MRIAPHPQPHTRPIKTWAIQTENLVHKRALVILHPFPFSNGWLPFFPPAVIDCDDVQSQHFLSSVFGAQRSRLLQFSNGDVVKGKLARMSLDKIQDIKTGNHPVLCSFPPHNYINYLLGLETPILISKEVFQIHMWTDGENVVSGELARRIINAHL